MLLLKSPTANPCSPPRGGTTLWTVHQSVTEPQILHVFRLWEENEVPREQALF